MRYKLLMKILLLTALLLTGLTDAMALERILVPGTRVEVDVPKGFVLSPAFTGLQHKEYRAAIVINEVPNPYLEFNRLYSDDNLAKDNMELLSRERYDRDGLTGQLLKVRQLINNEVFTRWIIITGDTRESVMIAGYYPRKNTQQFETVIKETLARAFWDSARILDHFTGLGFRIDDVPGLRIAARMNNNLIFTKNGRLPDQYYTDALLIVSFRPYEDTLKFNEQFAEAQFNKITLLNDHHIDETKQLFLGALDTISIEGTGAHRYLGYNVAALQIMSKAETGMLVAQGFTGLAHRENDFEVFRTTIGTFRTE